MEASIVTSRVETDLCGIESKDVDTVWERVEPMLRPAIDRQDFYSMEDIKAQCRDKSMQLWVLVQPEDMLLRGAIVTQICEYPQKTTCLILLCGGRGLADWKDCISMVEEWAKLIECDDVEFIGRKGWGKVFPQYDIDSVVYRKTITKGPSYEPGRIANPSIKH